MRSTRERCESAAWYATTAGLGGGAVLSPLANTDIWWHLAAGRHILLAGLPDTDPFSISGAGMEWVDVHWLFQIGCYAIHALGGVLGLVLVKALLFASGLLLLVAASAQVGGRQSLPLLGVGIPACMLPVRGLVLARPIVITLICLAVFFWVLERYRMRGNPRLLLLLPITQVVWANGQGLHPLGPVVVATCLVGLALQRLAGLESLDEQMPPAAARHLAWTLVGCVVAPLVSPYGLDAWILPRVLLGRINPGTANLYAVNVSEFVPPWMLSRVDPWSMAHLPLFVVLALASFLLVRRRFPASRLLLMCGFAVLALMANRNILLAYWIGVPIAWLNVVTWLQRGSAQRLRTRVQRLLAPRRIALAALLVALLVAILVAREPKLSEPAPFRVPVLSAASLVDHERSGKVFTSVRYGGYLIWARWPQIVPYIDGRLVVRTREQFGEYLEAVDEPEAFDRLQQRIGFAWAVLPTAFPQRYLGLVRHLDRHPDWVLVTTDGTEIMFAHESAGVETGLDLRSQAVTDDLAVAIERRYVASPPVRAQALRNLGTLLVAVGATYGARQVLRQLRDSTSRALVARSYYLEGDADLAAAEARAVLAEHRDHVDSLTLLARIALERGESRQALDYLRQALDADPYDEQGRALLEGLEGQTVR